MDPERWKQVDELLQSALRLPSDQREGFLRQACAGDAALEREVQSVLSHRKAGSVAREAEPDRVSAPLEGQSISHYRVIGKLAGGGMGVVYEGEDVRLKRRVALKFLPEHLVRNKAALMRLEREARTASSLNHPNICTIYEVEEHEGRPVIVMELLQGQTLKDRLQNGRCSEKELLGSHRTGVCRTGRQCLCHAIAGPRLCGPLQRSCVLESRPTVRCAAWGPRIRQPSP